MKVTQNEIIQLDKQKINIEILKKGKYERKGTLIRKWEDKDSDFYIAQITKLNTSFIGILNNKFEREGYGLNKFSNGDQYFGYFENDLRNKHGIYFWAPQKKNNNMLHKEIYYGLWKNNFKDTKGLYLWLDENEDNNDFQKSNFDCYIGNIKNDKYIKGTYLSKRNDDYYLYYGLFDENGKKNDKNAFFYSSNDRLIKGNIVNDNFSEGYIAYFNSETGNLDNFFFCKFGNDNCITLIKKEKELNIDNVENIKCEMNTFRNVILEEDYFTNIYNKYKEISEFIKNNMTSIDVFDDKKKFPEIIKLSIGYNSLNVFAKIERKVYNRKN